MRGRGWLERVREKTRGRERDSEERGKDRWRSVSKKWNDKGRGSVERSRKCGMDRIKKSYRLRTRPESVCIEERGREREIERGTEGER